jgi:hypothetical protein
MADEVVTLAAAMLFPGHRSVLGMQLSVPDRVAARVAKSIYHDLNDDGFSSIDLRTDPA